MHLEELFGVGSELAELGFLFFEVLWARVS